MSRSVEGGAAVVCGLCQTLGRIESVQQLVIFLKTLTGPAWLCCLVAIASVLLGVYAWLPGPHHSDRLIVFIVLAAIAALSIAFVSMAGHHLVAWEHRKDPQPKIHLPRVYWRIAAPALAYFLVVFFGSLIYYPHGIDLGATVNLRIASSGSLFLSIAALGFTQWAGLRVRALQSAP